MENYLSTTGPHIFSIFLFFGKSRFIFFCRLVYICQYAAITFPCVTQMKLTICKIVKFLIPEPLGWNLIDLDLEWLCSWLGVALSVALSGSVRGCLQPEYLENCPVLSASGV